MFLTKLPLQQTGTLVEGDVNHCCWPCTCDIVDAIASGLEVRTQLVALKDGDYDAHFITLPDPCEREDFTLIAAAPEIQCVSGSLQDASRVDGKVIIGLLDPASKTGQEYPNSKCEERAAAGYQSGMGDIFRNLAGL